MNYAIEMIKVLFVDILIGEMANDHDYNKTKNAFIVIELLDSERIAGLQSVLDFIENNRSEIFKG